ncbi:MAG: hypothetical protein M1829_006846 [Trizodia sp. TS-e1964]|nr:MAG: hypothetical protein M1829_006846 [Trizodia sp. TS-e1964]
MSKDEIKYRLHDVQSLDAKAIIRDAKRNTENFDLNSILRGAYLTIIGALRALRNPGLFKYEHYKQAAIAVAVGIAIRIGISIPIFTVKLLLKVSSFFFDSKAATWDDDILLGIDFIEKSVLQIPFFVMSLMRYLTPTLDVMFMESLEWVDLTYNQKHKSENPSQLRAPYHSSLKKYPTHGGTASHKNPMDAALGFLYRYARRSSIALVVYMLSFVPYLGRFVLPAASVYTFGKAVGPVPAAVIFGCGSLLPRHYLVVFLQSYFSSRSLMRELLEPYFSRIKFTREQKRRWFRDREGLLFGFAIGFYIFLKIPLLGVLIYGIAEASTAYLITKITDPPPPPHQAEGFAESQVRWKNKFEFLRLPLGNLDAHNISANEAEQNPLATVPAYESKKSL